MEVIYPSCHLLPCHPLLGFIGIITKSGTQLLPSLHGSICGLHSGGRGKGAGSFRD